MLMSDAADVVASEQQKVQELDAKVERCSIFIDELTKHETFFDKEEVGVVREKYKQLLAERDDAKQSLERKTKLYHEHIVVYEKAIQVRNNVIEENEAVKNFLADHKDIMTLFASKHAQILQHLKDAKLNLKDA